MSHLRNDKRVTAWNRRQSIVLPSIATFVE
jgi:hypothetical protein